MRPFRKPSLRHMRCGFGQRGGWVWSFWSEATGAFSPCISPPRRDVSLLWILHFLAALHLKEVDALCGAQGLLWAWTRPDFGSSALHAALNPVPLPCFIPLV